MQQRFLYILLTLFCCQTLPAQVMVTGKVINAETDQPLSSASVFLSNTSFGDSTDIKGNFRITGIRNGTYKLVVSYVGYETFVMMLNTRNVQHDILIKLKPKINELAEVVLQPLETQGWDKWGQFFIDNFIGTTPYAKECVFENIEAVKFRFDKKNNILHAYARTPIVISNWMLGYQINYKLEEFSFDFATRTLVYNGYPLFIDLAKTNTARARAWKKKRVEAYKGSLLNFMRAYFSDNLQQDGFEVRSLDTIPNLIKQRAEYFAGTATGYVPKIDTAWSLGKVGYQTMVNSKFNGFDSTLLFKKALKQPDRIVSMALMPRDTLAFRIDSTTLGLYAIAPLEVINVLKSVPLEYKRAFPVHRFEDIPVSQLTFLSTRGIGVSGNGSYAGPHDLKITGYWSWWETVSTMLPFDYEPPMVLR